VGRERGTSKNDAEIFAMEWRSRVGMHLWQSAEFLRKISLKLLSGFKLQGVFRIIRTLIFLWLTVMENFNNIQVFPVMIR